MVHKSNVFVKHNRLVRTLKLSHTHNPIRFINANAWVMYFLLRRPWRPLRGDGPANFLARLEAPQERQRPERLLMPSVLSQILQIVVAMIFWVSIYFSPHTSAYRISLGRWGWWLR